MSTVLYDKAVIAAQTTKAMNLLAGNIQAILVNLALYTPDLTNHQYLSDIPVGARIGTLTLSSKTLTGRVFDAADGSITGLSSPPAGGAIVIVENTGTDTTSPLIAYIDGIQTVTVAAAASTGATSVSLDPVASAIASGATMTKVSGSGPSTITTAGAASAGGRSIATAALSSGVAAGDVYTVAVSGVGLPTASGVSQVNIAWDNGANKIFKL